MTNDEEWARVSSGHAEALLAENDRLRAVNEELQSENTRLRQALNDREGLEFRKAVELACDDRLTNYKRQLRELEKKLESLNDQLDSRSPL
jgi:predicted RNase H-like nuclease (RuvC/YqgF family)